MRPIRDAIGLHGDGVNLLDRIRAILVDPHAEWERIERESGDAAYLAARYVAPLALVPAVAGFVGGAVVGVTVPEVGTIRVPVFSGLLAASLGYVSSFVVVILLALFIDALAPRFEGRRNFGAALKLAVYSFTPVWLAGIFLLIPGLRFLNLLGLYGGYLLWTGLPALMKVPKERAPIYACAAVACAVALMAIAGAVQRMLFPGAAAM
jgi:hypothetical protein